MPQPRRSRAWYQPLTRWLFARQRLDVWFLLLAMGILLFVFWLLNPDWINRYLLQALIAQYSPLALVSVAMTFAIIASNIDLSPGSMIGLSGAVIGLVFTWTGNIWLSLLAGLGTAIGVGLLQSLLVAGLGLNAVIVTLGTYIWARGLSEGANAGVPIVVGGGISGVVNASWAGFTLTAPVVVVVYLVGAYILSRTKFGRYTYAMGGDPLSARRAGIAVARYTTAIFLFMSMMVAAATIITVGQLGSADASAGTNIELDAIIAVIIGGSRLQGGEGSLGRTAMGVAFVAILNSGLLALGLSQASFELYSGLALLAVLSIQVMIRRIAIRQPVSAVLLAEPGHV